MGRRYSEADRERGLIALAFYNGNRRLAADNLKPRIPEGTLKGWQIRYPDRYAEIRSEILPKIREQAAEEHMALASASMELEAELLEKLRGSLDEIPARDLPGAARNISTMAAIHVDKAQVLNDQPTQRIAIDLQGTIQDLRSMGVDPAHVLNLTPESEETVSPAPAELSAELAGNPESEGSGEASSSPPPDPVDQSGD